MGTLSDVSQVLRAESNRLLDFELGSSENCEVCRDLVSRLVSSGFEPKHRLLAVLDGADAL